MNNNISQVFFTLLLSMISIYFENLAIPIIILTVVIICDYITGMYKSIKTTGLDSKTGIKGIIKKMFYYILIIVAMVTDYILATGMSQVGVTGEYKIIVSVLVTYWLIINEMISIVENLNNIGVPIPKFLSQIISKIKIKVENKGNEEGR